VLCNTNHTAGVVLFARVAFLGVFSTVLTLVHYLCLCFWLFGNSDTCLEGLDSPVLLFLEAHQAPGQ
jgi:hypothetical protein